VQSLGRKLVLAVLAAICLVAFSSSAAVAAEPGTISGKAQDSVSHFGFAGVEVCPVTEGDTVEACTTTGSEGEFTTGPLPPGNYYLSFSVPGNSFYQRNWYPSVPNRSEATAVTVQEGQSSGPYFDALIKGGKISGFSVDRQSGGAVRGFVCAVKVGEPNVEGCGFSVEPNGAYEISGLPEGAYAVHFLDNGGGGHLQQFYDESARQSEAEPVSVAVGEVTEEIDASMYLPSTISGTVTSFSGGGAVEGDQVCAYEAADTAAPLECVSTNSDGEYTIHDLQPGEYVVHFGETDGLEAQAYDGRASLGEADPIDLGVEEDKTGIDAVLHAVASISGEVTDAAGDPVPDGTVNACARSGGSEHCTPVEDGRYELEPLPAGEYVVRFESSCSFEESCSAYVTQFYEGVGEESEATTVHLSAEQAVQGIDAEMTLFSSISGTVAPSGGGTLGAEELEACAYRGEQPYATRCADVGSDGRYRINQLPQGDYVVEFLPRGYCNPGGCFTYNYLAQYYDGAARREDAESIALGDEEERAGVDVTIQPGGVIAGEVLEAGTEDPVEKVEVCAYRPGRKTPRECTQVVAGRYELTGLPTGSWIVGFKPQQVCFFGCSSTGNWVPQFYDGVANRTEAEPVAVSSGGMVDGIDATLEPGAQVSGLVTDGSTSEPVGPEQVEVCARPAGGSGTEWSCAETEPGGTYTISGLSTGLYVIRFSAGLSCGLGGCERPNFATQYYEGGAGISEAIAVQMTAGTDVHEIDATMSPGGGIEGTVTAAAGGAPIENVTVCAENVEAESAPCVQTDANGEYEVAGLDSGQYRVEFQSGSGFANQFYDREDGAEEADLVTVTAGSTTPGINASLGQEATISGTVTGPEGPFYQAEACAYLGASKRPTECGRTGPDGSYEIEELPPGTYFVQFAASYSCGSNGCSRPNLVGQWYQGKASRSEATGVTVAAGGSQAGIDGTLVSGGRIAGTVTAEGGLAAEETEVCAYPVGSDEAAACVESDEYGHYAIPGLRGIAYTIEFAPGYEREQSGCEQPDYAVQFYDGVGSRSIATPIAVTVGATTTGIDALMTSPVAPVSESPPEIGGTPAVGQTLSCSVGTWSGLPSEFAFAWLRDGQPISGAMGETYVVADADAGHSLICRVTGSNAKGSEFAESAAVNVPASSKPEEESKPKPSNPNPGPGPNPNPGPPAAGLAVAGAKASVKGSKAIIPLTCGESGPCKGTLKLTAKAKGKTIVLGKARFSLAPGKSTRLKVKMSKRALALLEAAGPKGLKAKLSGTGIAPRSLKLR
jgi:hypothetical protein